MYFREEFMIKNKKRHLKKGFKKFLIVLILVLSVSYIGINSYLLIKNCNNINVYKENLNSISEENISILEELKKLSKYDKRVNNIIDNYKDYPEILLEMLIRDTDMLDFVLDYPQKIGNVYSDNVGKVKKDTIPLLLQWDTRWGYAKYGDSSIAISGCGPTALSMVIVGLTGDNSMTPYVIAKFSESNGYYLTNSGTSWNLMTEGTQKLGIKSKEISLSKSEIYNALKKGHPIICSMRPGDFTTTGHFIVLTSIEDGKIRVNDPNSKKRSETLWTYEKLEYQIKNLWEFSK